MNVDVELTVDKHLNPLLRIKHHDKNDSLEQKLLGLLLKGFKEDGIKISNPNGYLEMGTNNSWEAYELTIANKTDSGWFNVQNNLPSINDRWQESDSLLCYDRETDSNFVAFYNGKNGTWILTHHISPNDPVNVTHWKKLPINPEL